VAKLFLILLLSGALADGLTPRQPPLLIDDSSTLDATR
jgi:hypothetical protein